MRGIRFTLVSLAFGAAACGSEGARQEGAEAGQAGREATAGDSAQIVAELLMDALGGEEAWEKTRFISFRWIVERGGEILRDRMHAWDRYENDYRLEFQDGDDQTLALFNVSSVRDESLSMEGDVWVNGRKLEAAARDSALERAYAIFINDTYWLLMPLKWRDPGVHLAYEGRTALSDGRSYATVHLTYDTGLGVTEDEFWGFVDPESGRMAAWQYHLENRDSVGPVVWWSDWQQVGPLLLAMDRRWDEDDTRIYFTDVAADRELPEDIFSPPTP